MSPNPEPQPSTLAELDRRLLEIQDEIGRARGAAGSSAAAAPAAPVPAAAPARAPAPSSAVDGVPPGLPVTAPPPFTGAAQPAQAPVSPPAGRGATPVQSAPAPTGVLWAPAPASYGHANLPFGATDPGADAHARAMVAQAQVQAARIVEQAEQEAAAIKGQIEDLIELRDHLDHSAQRIVREYETVRGRIESRFAGVAPPLDSTVSSASPSDASASPVGEEFYEGSVSVTAGPFGDLTALSMFERAVAAAAAVNDVYIRGFEGRHAIVEMHLEGKVALIDELREVVPWPFVVRERGADALTIDLNSQPPGSAPGSGDAEAVA